ncbi:MAG: HlyC/CorC family transporter [Candidatus Azotimanducaceae bacterium]|uniref:Magnesium and cobalt efflux protein CorC n=1 Tax=OM182 bacterium TaxID=2510334 RepID=A0A520S323_9GAMM|nr:magnesium/cobalt efflux protein [Gammaproteobacteria bacterium]OUV66987.1 MAG: magnesium/cobalt efflux protein [Gammaproteobacteria bacterium TMED133]RZO76846.1 MAG: CBS domain-containing protein [OM182 bacterium]
MTEQTDSDNRTWLDKLKSLATGTPGSREELIELLRSAQQRDLLDDEALSIIEGALVVSDMQAREIMVPRSQVVFVKLDSTPEEFLPTIIESGHSRFPVVDENPDNVLGILLAKDLLLLALENNRARFNMRDLLRSFTPIPESKRVNVLLQEFRKNRSHLAVVLDEYSGISGIVTIEDVLEQIVGDIEDEYDYNEEDDFIKPHEDGSYTVKAQTLIQDFNQYFGSDFSEEELKTIGGIVTQKFGHLPKRDEIVETGTFKFKVLNADSRRIHLLQLTLSED